jgi:hypothetical protein
MYDDLTHEMARLEQAGRVADASRRRVLRSAPASEQGPAEWVAPRQRVHRWGWGWSERRAHLAFAPSDAGGTVEVRLVDASRDARQLDNLVVLDGAERSTDGETTRRRPVDGGDRITASDRALLLLFLLGHVDEELTGAPVEAGDPAHVHRFFHADDRLAG